MPRLAKVSSVTKQPVNRVKKPTKVHNKKVETPQEAFERYARNRTDKNLQILATVFSKTFGNSVKNAIQSFNEIKYKSPSYITPEEAELARETITRKIKK